MGFISRVARTLGLARAEAAYKTTGSGGRARFWRGSSQGVNSALQGALGTLRDQSRDLVRKNATAGAAIDRLVANVIGTGIKPKLTDPAVAAVWTKWTDEATADGMMDFYGAQSLVFGTVATAGEVFIRHRPRLPVDRLTVPYQFEIIEPEQCPLDHNFPATPDRGEIRMGVEFDRVLRSKRVAYWMHPRHPNDGGNSADLNEPVRIPASEITHVFLPIRPGQVRGEPWLARVLAKLKDLDEYDAAELTRKKVATLLVGFIRKALPDGLTLDDLKATYGTEAEIDTDDVGAVSMEPGTMQVLEPGEDVSFNQPSDVGGQYEVFMRVQNRSIAAALGLLYEQITGDFSQVNDRTWRAAVSEFRRRAAQWQHQLMVFQFCRPVFQRWADLGRLARVLPASFDPTVQPLWTPQAWAYINPVQDVQARRDAVLAGFDTRASIVSELGEDVERIDRENAADQTRADELGLVYTTDGRVAAATAPVPPDPADLPEPAPAPAPPQQTAALSLSDVLDVVRLSTAQGPKGTTVVLPEHMTVAAMKAVGPIETEVLATDDMGRITKMRRTPVAGGPSVVRTVHRGEDGHITGTTDEEEVDG